MRGFGAGLIVATIILMISGKIQNNNKLLEQDNKETQSTGSVIAFTKESEEKETKTAENKETGTQSEMESQTSEMSTDEIQNTSKEITTERPTVKITTGDGSGEVELVFSGVYSASQAADILYDAGIIEDKTEFYIYMDLSGYATKMRDGTYRFRPGDSYETIAKTITQTK